MLPNFLPSCKEGLFIIILFPMTQTRSPAPTHRPHTALWGLTVLSHPSSAPRCWQITETTLKGRSVCCCGHTGTVPTMSPTLPSRLLSSSTSILMVKFKATVPKAKVVAETGHSTHAAGPSRHSDLRPHSLPCRTAQNIALRLLPPCSQTAHLQIFSLFL